MTISLLMQFTVDKLVCYIQRTNVNAQFKRSLCVIAPTQVYGECLNILNESKMRVRGCETDCFMLLLKTKMMLDVR